MKLNCLNCNHEFDGTISYDELGWHSACPECGSSFDVDVPEGDIILAFADPDEDEESPDDGNFTDDFHYASLSSYYAFSSRKDFLKKWEEKVYDENPDGMWYWAFEGSNCITYGGPNPDDIELICEAWGIELDESGDVAILLGKAYASCQEDSCEAGVEKEGVRQNKVCFNCPRKSECYSATEIRYLNPGETYKDKTGYDCGVAYTNYEELRKFVEVIGEVINAQGKRTQDKILKAIAEKCNLPVYNIRLEFEKRQSVGKEEAHIMLCTLPDDDAYYCKWFVVETEWLKGRIQEEHDGELSEKELREAVSEFLENYTWDQTWWIYQTAKNSGEILSEGHDK